jgi:hypothetical protein
MNNKSFRVGNSGFVKSGLPYSSYQEACLRLILLRAYEVQPTHDARTLKIFEVGKLNEQHFINRYMQDTKHTEEMELIQELIPGVTIGAHSDVVTDEMVYELKSATSKNTYKQVFEGNKPKLSNLTQLVNYLIILKRQKGMLVYTYYGDMKEEIEPKDMIPVSDIFFEITFSEEGQVLVNGEDIYNLNVRDVYNHTLLAAQYLKEDKVYPHRPASVELGGNPCHYCPFKKTCEQYDRFKAGTKAFVNLAKEHLEIGKDK